MLQFTNVLRPSGLLLLFRELEHRTCLWAVGNVATGGIPKRSLDYVNLERNGPHGSRLKLAVSPAFKRN